MNPTFVGIFGHLIGCPWQRLQQCRQELLHRHADREVALQYPLEGLGYLQIRTVQVRKQGRQGLVVLPDKGAIAAELYEDGDEANEN